jgi:predicted NAD-dependent protein-ADP-ribosyltransferase YbiA (DUF1768 family)
MDIGKGKEYPAGALSNFSPHSFVFDGVECASMEGLLQSFKFPNPEIQKEVCKLVGLAAKYRGKKRKWFRDQMLYWQGQEFPRQSKEYQELLDRAYQVMYEQNKNFRNALEASGTAILMHSIGKKKENETILTEREFCRRLMKLREQSK